MSEADEALLFDALMTGKNFVEDAIELERTGHQSGFKPGALRNNLKQIERALTVIGAISTEGPANMLEEQIEKLTDQVAKLNDRVASQETKQTQANDLLAEILAVLKGGAPATPPVAVAVDNTADEASDTQAPEPETEEKVQPEDTGDSWVPVIGDVREALMAYNKAHGRTATEALMLRFIADGAKPVIGEIVEEKYADVIRACAVNEKAAA